MRRTSALLLESVTHESHRISVLPSRVDRIAKNNITDESNGPTMNILIQNVILPCEFLSFHPL